MPKRLYVCNLPYDTTEEKIREFCGRFVQRRKRGTVGVVKMIRDLDTQRFRGFAFVDLPDDVRVEDAIADLDGEVLENREIGVQEAREKQRGAPRRAPPRRVRG